MDGRGRWTSSAPVVVAAAAALAGCLNLLWAWFLATGGGDLAAQNAWAWFAGRHPGSAYSLAWYGGIHPFSYSVISPYVMALLGVRTVAVAAGTFSAAVLALVLVRSGITRPWWPALWGALALSCNVASGRVTFALGVLFALAAVAVTVTVDPQDRPGARWQAPAVVSLGVLATLASPVAGLFLEVVAAGLYLTERRRAAWTLALGPPPVVAAGSLLFPFSGVQPISGSSVLLPVGCALALAVLAPRAWRTVRAGAPVYAVGVLATWAVASPIGSNVERLALLFGGVLLLAAATQRRTMALWVAFAVIACWQVLKPIGDLSVTAVGPSALSWVRQAEPLLAELRRLHADRGRVEAVPVATHREAFALARHVNLARGWNRQLDTERHPLFYDGTLTPRSYHAWLRRWSVQYVVLARSAPDWAAGAESRIVRHGQPWLRPVWADRNWRLYRLADPAPLVDPPATIQWAGPAELVVNVPARASITIRIPWSPWLRILGDSPGCVAPHGEWTRLNAPVPGRYRIGGPYELPRGTPCA
jgi:hypothetical protein